MHRICENEARAAVSEANANEVKLNNTTFWRLFELTEFDVTENGDNFEHKTYKVCSIGSLRIFYKKNICSLFEI